MTKNAIVIGAGIVGLATARALAVRGHKVKVFERSQRAVGASIRNFGMVWPIGQPTGALYPQAFADCGITRCKLRMMRTPAQPARLGAWLTHYKAFEKLPALRSRFEVEMPEYLKWGIHVLVSQNQIGEATLGDTHKYGLHHDPFDRAELNDLVIKYLEPFCRLPKPQITETWHGIYPKLPNVKSWFVEEPEPGVTILYELLMKNRNKRI